MTQSKMTKYSVYVKKKSLSATGCGGQEDYRNRTERLRAEANRDLLRLISGHEDNEAERLGRLRAGQR